MGAGLIIMAVGFVLMNRAGTPDIGNLGFLAFAIGWLILIGGVLWRVL